ncbi:hypothetical protein [Cyclobacterium sp.]|uniref:hypothetical protein n=1 Tax=Cyclobacterium sp. TaxID=1966343 RepID=UPI0019C628CC|nr:hypothetical protein [Cyclobacterium sp.]MBD3630522.1 hypothetical protein [Cyclobacterium sp.]
MKEQTKKTTTQPTGKNEVEQLKAQIKKLETQLSQQPQSLEEKIKFFQEKQEMIKRLSLLDQYADSLLKVGEDIQKDQEEDEFLTERHFLKITYKPTSYGSEQEVLKIQNPKLIGEVLNFAIGKINEKRNELQTLINA